MMTKSSHHLMSIEQIVQKSKSSTNAFMEHIPTDLKDLFINELVFKNKGRNMEKSKKGGKLQISEDRKQKKIMKMNERCESDEKKITIKRGSRMVEKSEVTLSDKNKKQRDGSKEKSIKRRLSHHCFLGVFPEKKNRKSVVQMIDAHGQNSKPKNQINDKSNQIVKKTSPTTIHKVSSFEYEFEIPQLQQQKSKQIRKSVSFSQQDSHSKSINLVTSEIREQDSYFKITKQTSDHLNHLHRQKLRIKTTQSEDQMIPIYIQKALNSNKNKKRIKNSKAKLNTYENLDFQEKIKDREMLWEAKTNFDEKKRSSSYSRISINNFVQNDFKRIKTESNPVSEFVQKPKLQSKYIKQIKKKQQMLKRQRMEDKAENFLCNQIDFIEQITYVQKIKTQKVPKQPHKKRMIQSAGSLRTRKTAIRKDPDQVCGWQTKKQQQMGQFQEYC